MYSQNNEEQTIAEYFGDFKGVFLDCGSNDGITLSNTYALSLKGWKGVYVEPSPKAYAKLRQNIPDSSGNYFYPYALGESNKDICLFESGEHLGKGDVGLLSTLVPEEKARWRNETFVGVTVKCFRWKTFLNRLLVKKFDFISIDAEGMDLIILGQMVAWPGFADVRCVCVEWNGKDEFKFDALMVGFRKIGKTPENLIYAR